MSTAEIMESRQAIISWWKTASELSKWNAPLGIGVLERAVRNATGERFNWLEGYWVSPRLN